MHRLLLAAYWPDSDRLHCSEREWPLTEHSGAVPFMVESANGRVLPWCPWRDNSVAELLAVVRGMMELAGMKLGIVVGDRLVPD